MAFSSGKAVTAKADSLEIEDLYDSLRKGTARLIGPDGQTRPLPESLVSFLSELTRSLNEGKPVSIVQNHAAVTTIEAASTLGVSRQFLVNLLEKGEIPFHMVGTHRRVYAQDLFAYKAKRDGARRKGLRELAQKEAEEGLYDRIPAVDGD